MGPPMTGCSLIACLCIEALAAHSTWPRRAADASRARRTTISPTSQVRKCADSLKRTLMHRYPHWSPEAEAQASEVQRVIDETLDFGEIARRTLGPRWESLGPAQRSDFTGVLQRLIERRPLERTLRIDGESSIA